MLQPSPSGRCLPKTIISYLLHTSVTLHSQSKSSLDFYDTIRFFSFSREKRIRSTYQQKLFCCFLTSGLLFFFLIRKLAVVKKTQKVPILSVAYDKISCENHPCLLNIFEVSQPSCYMRFLFKVYLR